MPTATPEPATATPVGPVKHTVQAGDTVAAIAQKYGSTIKDIIQINNLSADGRLRVGQELIIPLTGPTGGPGPTATPNGGALMYTVRSGDTISGIAERFGSRIDWILAANKLQPTDFLRIGQALLVPLSPATPTPQPTLAVTPQTPTVTPTPGLTAPALLSPPDASVLTGEADVFLSWTSVGVLAPEQYYVVTLKSGEKATPITTWWTKSTLWRLPAEYRGSGRAGMDYLWQVQVRTGSAEQPGAAVGPASAERRFTWR